MSPNKRHEDKAYRLFQIAFAGLETELTLALVSLLRPAERNVAVSIVRTIYFRQKLATLRRAIKVFDRYTDLQPDLAEFLEIIKHWEELAIWRNERVHARVQFSKAGIMLLNQDGAAIDLDPAIYQSKVAEIAIGMAALKKHVPGLVSRLELIEADKAFAGCDLETDHG